MTWEWFISSALIRSTVATSTRSCASSGVAPAIIAANRAARDRWRNGARVGCRFGGQIMNELQRIELKTEDRVNNGARGCDCHFPTYVSVMATPHSHDPVQDYTRHASSADVAAVRVEWRARRLSWSRLAGARVVVFSIVYANRGGSPGIAWITAAIGAGAFIVLVRLHRHAAARATRERETAAACRAGVARCLRDWPNVPPPRLATSPAGRGATARDLDIFGDVSLFHLL